MVLDFGDAHVHLDRQVVLLPPVAPVFVLLGLAPAAVASGGVVVVSQEPTR